MTANSSFRFVKANLADRPEVKRLFEAEAYDRVVNLAAQVGPRYSLINPHAYADSNLVGFLNVLEGCRQQKVPHLVFASTSSVYGANAKVPFSVEDRVDQPVSLYAATKRANELMAYSYAHLFGLRSTGLRFFTVYGPWGRPDMAPFLFTRALFEGHPIDVFNHGNMSRDFTYIDDVVEIVRRAIDKVPEATPSVANEGQAKTEPGLPLRLYNVGNNSPVTLFPASNPVARGPSTLRGLVPGILWCMNSRVFSGKVRGPWAKIAGRSLVGVKDESWRLSSHGYFRETSDGVSSGHNKPPARRCGAF